MNNQEKEFNKAAETFKGVSLSTSEKNAMLKNIYEGVGDTVQIPENIPSPFGYSVFFLQRRTLAALTVVFLMTASTSYASWASLESLPGDPLYPMKVSVIEPIGLAVRVKEEEKVNYRVNLLKERVAEIERLKEDGRLASHNELASYKAAQKNISDIEASPSFDAEAENIELSTQVETYNSIILEEEFKLKTKLKINILRDESEDETSTSSPQKNKDRVVPETEPVNDVVEEVEETLDRAGEVTETIEEVVTPVVEEVEDVLPVKIPEILKIGL